MPLVYDKHQREHENANFCCVLCRSPLGQGVNCHVYKCFYCKQCLGHEHTADERSIPMEQGQAALKATQPRALTQATFAIMHTGPLS
eukprot:5833424-Amphidinium_carterae.1